MKYFPLIWAALRRRPVRTIVTFLSVTVAFTLFGLMIGLHATIDLMEQRGRTDRIWTVSRFDNEGLSLAVAQRIATLPGVKKVTVMWYLGGYVGDPKNRVFVWLSDREFGEIFADWQPTPQQWDAIHQDRRAVVMSRKMAALYHKNVGDILTVISPETVRADGTQSWTFKVVGIGEEDSQNPGGYIMGNYDYFDKARPLGDQGKINEVDTLMADPAKAPAMAEHIDRLFANSATPTRSQTEKMAYSAGNMFGGMDVKTVTRNIALAGLIMMFFLVASVIAKSVRERFAEFATLRTIGFSDDAITALVVLEAAVPCLLGAVCGIEAAGWLGTQLPKLMPPMFGIPTPVMSLQVILWGLASAGTLALASTVLPILRLRRMDIASALSGRA